MPASFEAQVIESTAITKLHDPVKPGDILQNNMQETLAKMGIDPDTVNKAIVTINSRLRDLPRDKCAQFSCIRQGWPHTIMPILAEWFGKHWDVPEAPMRDRSGDVILKIQWPESLLNFKAPTKPPEVPSVMDDRG